MLFVEFHFDGALPRSVGRLQLFAVGRGGLDRLHAPQRCEGFVAAAVTGGLFFGGSKKLWHFIVLSLCACAVNYVIGGAFIYVWLIVNGSQDIASSMVNWVFVFIPKDIVLAVLAAIVAWKVKPVIVRMRQKYVRRDGIGSSDAQNQGCTSGKGGGFQSDIKDKYSK